MKAFINKLPTPILVLMSLFLGLAPFAPEPHVWQKLMMLFDGTLSKPIDIFDFFLHGTPWILLGIKLYFVATEKK